MSDAGGKNDKGPGEQEDGIPTASFPGSGKKALGQVGPYKLLSVLGEGGCGMVYLAEQQRPVKRRVALKIIKPGMDSKQVIARFEAEEQALALLDHPNVAQVYEAGMTEAGRSYFAMECVKGIPITEYCDREKLSIERRLQLFLQVCEGLQHAHQKGVIHRDIKPSNILVFVQEKKEVPKIIDFGVAKAISQPLTERTLFTEQGQLVGTPEYMSPEQAETSQDIDTRTDIYSLGVLLYELLTGVLPFEAKTLREGGFEHVRHVIREEEPKTPSTRLSRLGDEEATRLAKHRRADIGTLRRRLRGDLDWITLKAMEKDRTRRYVSAAELAADIRHYLNSEPVLASPPSTVYRVKKFVRRNRASVTAASVVAAALVVGFVVSMTMYFRAEALRVQAEQAREKEAVARAQAEQAREKETVARTRAEQAEEATKEKAEELRRTLYVNSIQLADAKYSEANIQRVRELLESCPNDLRGWEWYRLNYIADKSIMTLRGHSDKVDGMAVSPDGKRIVSGSNDKTIKVWDSATGTELMTLRGHGGWVGPIAFSPDGKHIISGSGDNTIKVWDAATGADLMTIRGHSDEVFGVAFSPDGKRIVSGSFDKTIKVWDAANGDELMTIRGHECMIGPVSFSPDGRRIVSGSIDWTIEEPWDQTIKVWDAATGAEVMTLRGHFDLITSIAFSPDGERIASGSWDKTVKVWDAATGAQIMTLRGHKLAVADVAFSPDGKRIVSGSNDGTSKVWDVSTGTELMTLVGHENEVCSVAFSPDGMHIISSSQDKTIKVWDAAIREEAVTLSGHRGGVLSVAFSPDGKRLVSGGNDETIKVWNVETWAESMTFRGHGSWVTDASFSPDGKRITSASRDKTVKVWDAATGEELMTLRGHDDWVGGASFSPDGRRIVSSGKDITVRVWDAATGEELMTLRGHGGRRLTFSPDGKRIVLGSSDGAIKVWDGSTGAEVMTLRGHSGFVLSVAFSPDSKRIVSCSVGDHTIKVWDAGCGAEVLTLHSDGPVMDVAFSPDGKRIISGSLAGTIKVWDSATGTELMTLVVGYDVSSVAFSPDGKTIAAGCFDNVIKLWESTTPAGGYELRWNAEAARRLVDELYKETGFYSEVIDKLKADKTLSESVRKVALQIANARRWEDAARLNNEGWAVVSLSDKSIEDYQDALEKAETAKSMEPKNPSILNTVGVAQYRVGAYEDALTTLTGVEKMQADANEEAEPANAAFMAMALHQLGRTEEAQEALGQLRGLFEGGQFANDKKAQGYLFEAEKLFAGGNNKLLSVWKFIEAGRLKEAVQQVEQLRSLQDAEIAGCMEGAVKWLGRAYYSRIESRWRSASDYAEMINNYEAVLRIDPDHAGASNELAWLRVTCPVAEFRDAGKAVEEASRACELTDWKNYSYLSTLSAAYSEVGDFAAAVKWQKEAIDLLPAEERPKWQANYQVRLKRYESGKPYTRKEQLVGWWKFDDGSGTVANDASGNGYNGSLNNMDESSWVKGVTRGALKFDGVDDYVSIPALGIYSDSLTISAWIRRDGQQAAIDTGIVVSRDGNTIAGISLGHGPGRAINHHLAYNWNDDQAAWDWDSELIVPDNEWVFVALIVEPTKATLYLGEDETVSSATNRIKHHIEEFDGFVRIGSDPLTNSRYFKGLIDDVRIYNRALSQADVAVLYAGEDKPIEE